MANKSEKLTKLARDHARRRRAPKSPLGWREAMNDAPWHDSLPAEHERAFRRAYAEELVKLGHARPAGWKPSGENLLARRTYRDEQQNLDAQSAKAKRDGFPDWNAWARARLNAT